MTEEEEIFVRKLLSGHYKCIYASNVYSHLVNSDLQKEIKKPIALIFISESLGHRLQKHLKMKITGSLVMYKGKAFLIY
jgi:hypothetical protein